MMNCLESYLGKRLVLTSLCCYVFLTSLGGGMRGAEPEHGLFRAVRESDVRLLESLLRQSTPPDVRMADGTTPLMMACLRATPECVRILLEAGADPNAANQSGITALLWAAGDVEKVRVLLEHGANVNTRSALGNTPLTVAAAYPGASSQILLLLERGADLAARNSAGRSALRNAVLTSDAATVELLLASAEKRGQLAELVGDESRRLIQDAAARGDGAMVDSLIGRSKQPAEGEPTSLASGESLARALLAQNPELACRLIDQGAELTHSLSPGAVPAAVLAAYTEIGDVSVAQRMLERGADFSLANERGENALTWARRRGNPELIQILLDAGVPDSDETLPEIPRRSINLHAGNQQQLLQESVRKSIRLLQHSSDVFLDNRSSCISCHHQNMPGVALGWARDRGFETDQKSIQRMIDRQLRSWEGRIARAYQMDQPFPVPPRFLGYGLWAFSELGHPADEVTEAAAWYLTAIQQTEGYWVPGMQRPPMGGAEIVSSVLAMRGLQLYPLRGREQEQQMRLERAQKWLAEAQPRYHQEQVYKLLGLAWSGWSADELSEQVQSLLAEQREDGGWAQLAHLQSDAWATGQTLVALHLAGKIPTAHPAYQRGLRFLLGTQFDDGSWFVKSRSWPFQKPFDSEFPFGHDQWISAPATAWAVMAMVLAVEPEQLQSPPLAAASIESDSKPVEPTPGPMPTPTPTPTSPGVDSDPGTGTIDFVRDIQPLLERSCVSCHHGDDPQGAFRVTDRASWLQGGESGEPAITPGLPASSPAVVFTHGKDAEMQMPPEDQHEKFPPFSEGEWIKFRDWVQQGAAWPASAKVQTPAY